MAGSVITWLSSFTFLGGLGPELASSAVEVRALKNSTVQDTVNTAGSSVPGDNGSPSLLSLAAGTTTDTGSAPREPKMSKSRPSSRRQSNVTGIVPCLRACHRRLFVQVADLCRREQAYLSRRHTRRSRRPRTACEV
jgi:hypothetical protein